MERFGLDDEALTKLILTVKPVGSRPLTPVDVANAFNTMMQYGATRSDCASLARLKGTSMVSKFLKLLTLSTEMQHNVEFGASSDATLGFSSASELTRLPEDDHVAACQAILKHRLTKEDVIQLVQLRTRSNKAIDDCVEQVLQLRPKIEKRYMFVGAIADELVAKHLIGISKDDRAELMVKVLDDMLSDCTDKSGRLGTSRFTVTGDSHLNKQIASIEGGFENAFNKQLAKGLISNEQC